MKKQLMASVAAFLAGAGVCLAGAPAAPSAVPSVRPASTDGGVLPQPISAPSAPSCDTCASCAEKVDDKCEACGPAGRFWFDAEYLFWWTRNGHVPPLVTTGTPGSAGVPGPGTSVLYGNGSALDFGEHSGARLTAGLWLDDENTLGVEASYFFLGSHSTDFNAGTNGAAGTMPLARPFFNAATNLPDAELTAFPGLSAGTVHVHSQSELQGAELNALYNICCGCNYRVDLLGGIRYLQLREGLAIAEGVNVFPGVANLGGDQIGVFDSFSTRNEFFGGQTGVKAEWRRDRLFVDVVSKLALGNTHEVVDISGATVFTTPAGSTRVVPAGLLALDSNRGHYTRDHFSVVPEETIRIGYQVTDHVRASIGYTFLYWTDVARPGDQIDPVLNPNKIPTSNTFGQLGGAARPAFAFHDTDFWAQGINLGLEIRY